MAFITDPEIARAAFTTASERARNAVNSLFSSYGFTRQNANGQWSTGAAGSAFDPSNFVTMNDNSEVIIDKEAAGRAGRGEFGTAFGYNRLTDVIGTSAAREALAKSALRGRGIRTGGLVNQAGTVAEAQQGRELGALGSEFIGTLGNIYGDIGTAVTGAVQSNIENIGTGAQAISDATSVSNAPSTGGATGTGTPAGMEGVRPGGNVPKPTKPGALYERRGPWQYLGKARGWVKK